MTNEKKYYMVRAMDSSDQYYNYFIDNKIVGIGWSNVNFSQYSNTEELIKTVRKKYYNNSNTTEKVISKKLNEIRRFINIKPGDCIVLPYHSSVAIAEVIGKIKYDEKAKKLDIANQFPVKYLHEGKELFRWPRKDIINALQRRLRVPGNAVSDLSEFSDEIERIKRGKGIDENEEKAIQKFKEDLLHRIQKGEKTTLKAGGRGLEELVEKIFKWSGYESKILAKTTFPRNADADIAATKEDEFSEQRILVQVKHHDEETSEWAVKQISAALEMPEYQKYDGCVITTANCVTKEAKKCADEEGIKIITGDILMDILFEKLDDMDSETKKILGISSVPQFMK